jgi:hypothetical protein
MNEGYTFAELKEAFTIFPSTLVAWRKRFDESDQLIPDLSRVDHPQSIVIRR